MHALIAVAVVAVGVGAAAPGFESDPELKKGIELMEAFEYEKAAAAFEFVSQRPGLSNPDKAVALIWLGLAAAELRDTARASLAFEEAVTADPLIVLPRDTSPKIKTLLEDARARVRLKGAKPATGTGTPGDATTGPGTGTEVQPPPPTEPKPGSGLFPVAIGTAVVGGVVALAGGVVWGVGLGLRQQAIDEPFQSVAAELRDQSVAAQIGGQITTGIGAVALIAGGALFAVDAMGESAE